MQLLTSCGVNPKTTIKQTDKNLMKKKSNPVVYFEIPVTDMDQPPKVGRIKNDLNLEKELGIVPGFFHLGWILFFYGCNSGCILLFLF